MLACAIAVLLLTQAGAVTSSAESAEPEATYYTYQEYKSLATVKNKSVWSYTRPSITIHGRSVSVKGLIIDGTYYIPFRAAANTLGAQYNYSSSTKTATFNLGSLTFTSSDGCYTSYANGRALFSLTPTLIMSDGRMYIPLNVFLKATGLSSSTVGSSLSITGSLAPLTQASSFYREDEVLWLARIIHAEAQGEPLLGQIGVGNVVLNRVKSGDFPNTIYGVIFDKKYGVQFSPTINGAIYNNPSYNATLAAKICLDGFDISDGALYFLQPHLSTSSWIPKNRPYAFTIGNHDFYK